MVNIYFKKLKDLREDNDLRQIDVAAVLNCKREVYARYESGRREIPVWALIKLADLYDVRIDYILGRSDVKKGTREKFNKIT